MRIILRVSLSTLVLFPVFLAIFPMLGSAPALAGTMTLTTYYPAPNGNYSKVTLYPQTQPSGVCRSGAMYVDNSTGAVVYCVDSNINTTYNTTGLPYLTPPFTTTSGTGAWGNLMSKTPVNGDPPNEVATKAYVDAAGNTGYPGLGMDMWNTYSAQQGLFTPHTNTCSGGEAFVAIAGSVGYCIENSTRPAQRWLTARETCVAAGKRLPEPSEWYYACVLNLFTSNSFEWASNFTLAIQGTPVATVVANGNDTGCENGGAYQIGNNNNNTLSFVFRCVH